MEIQEFHFSKLGGHYLIKEEQHRPNIFSAMFYGEYDKETLNTNYAIMHLLIPCLRRGQANVKW